jgi:hypothetical protein
MGTVEYSGIFDKKSLKREGFAYDILEGHNISFSDIISSEKLYPSSFIEKVSNNLKEIIAKQEQYLRKLIEEKYFLESSYNIPEDSMVQKIIFYVQEDPAYFESGTSFQLFAMVERKETEREKEKRLKLEEKRKKIQNI